MPAAGLTKSRTVPIQPDQVLTFFFFVHQSALQEHVQSLLVCQVSRPMISLLRIFGIQGRKCKTDTVRSPANDLGVDDNGIRKSFVTGTGSLQSHLDQRPWIWPLVSKEIKTGSTYVPESVRLWCPSAPVVGNQFRST
jgi:hypothetical protein